MNSQSLTFMPTRPLTIILNSDQSKQITLLLDGSFEPDKQSILRHSMSMFKQHNLSRVFFHGGLELESGWAIPSSVKRVFVSIGEDYTSPPAVIRIVKVRSHIEDIAIEQLRSVSELPGVRVVVGLPDLHSGTRFPNGCAVAADDVYPALIGSDIGCGIAVYALTPPMTVQPLIADISPYLASLLQGLDDPWGGDVHDWLESHGILRHSPFDKSCLGTIGGGNHFAEICIGSEMVNRRKARELGIFEGALYLIVHSGSRGLGAMIQAAQTINDPNPCLPTYSLLLDSYMEEHQYAVRWAAANRDLIAHRIMMCLFDNTDDPIELKKLIDVAHNTVTRSTVKLHSDDEPTEVWIHRKGAVPTDQGMVPCPGNRSDITCILAPLGDGNYNLHSLAHGAGRMWPRQDVHSGPGDTAEMTVFGSTVVCGDPNSLVEERAEAYKPIVSIVNDMKAKGVCSCIAKLTPVVTYKIRDGGVRRT